MDSSTQTSDSDIKLNSDLFNLAEKLQIELQKKDEELQNKDKELQKKDEELQRKAEELAKERQEKQEFSAFLDVKITRLNQFTELLKAVANTTQQNYFVLQMSLWKSFPFPDLTYYIKMQSGLQNGQFRFLYADPGYKYLRASTGDQSPSEFKFIKNSDGSFSIYAMEKSLKTDTNSSRVGFAETGNDGSAEKFVLFFHKQDQHAGLLVDKNAYPLHMLVKHGIFIDINGPILDHLRTLDEKSFRAILWRCVHCKKDFGKIHEFDQHCKSESHLLVMKGPSRQKKYTLDHVLSMCREKNFIMEK